MYTQDQAHFTTLEIQIPGKLSSRVFESLAILDEQVFNTLSNPVGLHGSDVELQE